MHHVRRLDKKMATEKEVDLINEARLDIIYWVRQGKTATKHANKGAIINIVNTNLMPVIEELRKNS